MNRRDFLKLAGVSLLSLAALTMAAVRSTLLKQTHLRLK